MAESVGSLNVIKKLDETVINRISAGEVIHKPINVIKELIENSLDAKSTSIQITLKDGGLKLIQIQDNGIGIRKDDLKIVCDRFTTSKLEKYEDLQNMKTYGFRGEALSSISLVSRVTIITKVEHEICGYKLSFIDGKPNSDIQPLAANRGTTIVIEDLFYNQQWRKDAIKSYNEEYNRIHELVTKYAINNSIAVTFSLKKFGEMNDLNTYNGTQIIDNIKLLYGPAIAKDLISVSLNDETKLNFSLTGFVSNTDVSLKKINFILFINNRLVNCSVLKKAIDELYCNHLMKGFHPFIYLSLKIELKNIDVNVHPTKSEVHFLNEEEICRKIIDMIESEISDGQQRSLPNNSVSSNTSLLDKLKSNLKSSATNKPTSISPIDNSEKKSLSKYDNLAKKINTTPKPYKQIRTDSRDRKMDEFLNRNVSNKSNKRKEIRLNSVLELRKNVDENSDTNIQSMISKSTYIGVANETFIACQHDTHLMLINIVNLNRELFYQLYLIEFSNFGAIKLSNPLPVRELAKLYIDSLTEIETANKQNRVDEIEQLLMDKNEMLNEYFSIKIDERAHLLTLPILLDGYVPNLGYLPQFIYCLANDVQWETEKECFHTIGQVLSQFYSKPPEKFATENDHNKWAKTVELYLYPAYKGILCPSKDMANNSTFSMAANLPDLYKVFERC